MKKNYTKKILLKVSLVLVLLVCVGVLNSQTYGPNLVQDPGFELVKASSPWTFSAYNTALDTTLDRIISGTQTLRLTGVNDGAVGSVGQTINVSSEGTYKFGYTGRALDAVGPSGGVCTPPRAIKGKVFSTDSGGELLLELVIAQGTDMAVSDEFVVPEGITQVYVQITKSFGICFADDVILQMKDDIGTALNSLSSNFKVIPNGDNSITIRSDEALKNIRIINICGQTILNTTTTNERIMLPRNATQGIYIVEATTVKGTKRLSRFMNK